MAKKTDPIRKANHFIREWRKAKGETQESLAEKIGSTSGAISQLENGIINYTQPTLEAIAAALGCRPGDLLNRLPSEGASTPENQLKLALLAYGVDAEDIKRAISSVKVFLDDPDELSSPDLPDDQLEPASGHRARVPSR